MIVAGVWTRVGFSNLKNCRTRIRIPKFWHRNGVGVWKSGSGHLWFLLAWLKLHCCWRCCIVKIHLTCIVVFYISLKLTNCEYCSKHDPAKR